MNTCWKFLFAAVAAELLTGNLAAAESASPAGKSFFEVVKQKARALANEEHKPAEVKLPDFLKNLGYDAYQAIHFRPERALWRKEPSRFQVEFHHPGFLYHEPVRMNVLEGGEPREIRFATNFFDYGGNRFPQPIPSDLYFVGLAVLFPVNKPSAMQQVAVFLGSSYFRLVGANQVFGVSARGLAVDTAEPTGEEFPRFTEFWIERPAPKADSIRLFALLDSKRVTGAYEFVIRPGEETITQVDAHLFFRDGVKKLGLAPLTSMFWFGENRTRYFPDFRPEVHDSDGLLVETPQHQWLWRPLFNPPKVHQLSAFPGAVGFGLLQRDRDFSHYQDLVARFESRPSYWVTPEVGWPTGRVELVEIPTSEERHDNIVAFWVPEQKINKRHELQFRYSLRAYQTSVERPPWNLLQVQSTLVEPRDKGRARFFVDFAGMPPKDFDPTAPVKAQMEVSKAKLEHVNVQANDMTGGWRAFFDLIPEGQEPVNARFWLHQSNHVQSETWSYQFSHP